MYDKQKIFILGMARSGYEVAKLLAKHNCQILITDKAEQDEQHVLELNSLGVNLIITDEPEKLLDDSFTYVVKNPGIILHHPVCLKAQQLNIPVINEVEVAYHYLKKGVKIIGITGSNGKTTTTSLIYELLKRADKPVHLGGNIGFPFCSLVDKVKENDIIVLELSAQQLHDFQDFKTDIAVLTNLTEVHLDHFKTYDYYKKTKAKIFAHHTNKEIAILNGNDQAILELTKTIPSKKVYFNNKESQVMIKDNSIYYLNEKVISLEDIKLKGIHNYENIMASIAVCKQLEIDNTVIKNVLSEFGGVPHRLEFVDKINERQFYNDSKATNVQSTITALKSFAEPIILLIGGLDRGHLFDELLPYLDNVKAMVCFGETKIRIKQFADDHNIICYPTDNLKETVKTAYNLSDEGDIILLSPACASWDEYQSFEQRGDEFKNIVEKEII